MTTIIETLEEQIAERLDEAKRRISITGDADAELNAACEDIHTYCQKINEDLQLIMNSCW